MQGQDAGAQTLVVVDDVEVTATSVEELHDALREREGRAEAGAHHHRKLRDVGQGGELSRGGHAKGVGVAVEVEPRDWREAHALVEFGPGRAGEDFHAVTERDEFAGEVTGVDPLSAAARVTPVDQEGHPVLAGLGRPSGYRLGYHDGFRQRPGGFGRGDGLGEGAGQGQLSYGRETYSRPVPPGTQTG